MRSRGGDDGAGGAEVAGEPLRAPVEREALAEGTDRAPEGGGRRKSAALEGAVRIAEPEGLAEVALAEVPVFGTAERDGTGLEERVGVGGVQFRENGSRGRDGVVGSGEEGDPLGGRRRIEERIKGDQRCLDERPSAPSGLDVRLDDRGVARDGGADVGRERGPRTSSTA